jgi:hypothetical protein
MCCSAAADSLHPTSLICLQAVASKQNSSSRLLPLRAAARGTTALRVVAFREDDRQPKRLDSLKMKTNQARTVQRQGKQQLQKTRNDINKREQLAKFAVLPAILLDEFLGLSLLAGVGTFKHEGPPPAAAAAAFP